MDQHSGGQANGKQTSKTTKGKLTVKNENRSKELSDKLSLPLALQGSQKEKTG